jgi:hypothetical protein
MTLVSDIKVRFSLPKTSRIADQNIEIPDNTDTSSFMKPMGSIPEIRFAFSGKTNSVPTLSNFCQGCDVAGSGSAKRFAERLGLEIVSHISFRKVRVMLVAR